MATNKGGGRIAINFGTSSSSSSKFNVPPSSLGKRPRPPPKSHAFGGADSDSDDDDDRRRRGKHEAITGFGADGAETEEAQRKKNKADAKKEFVIARQPNRDWRDEMKGRQGRGGKNLLPPEARATQQSGGATVVDTAPADQDSGIKWGLTVKAKPAQTSTDDDGDAQQDNGAKPTAAASPAASPPPPPRTADDEAMDALLGKLPAKEQKVIVTEDDAYARDVRAAGAMPTPEDYEAMPVEEFGAALLRGMGWDGRPRGDVKAKEVRRRQNRLGLGAKELKDAEDLGGWNQNGVSKKRPPRLADYRRDEERRKEQGRGGRDDSYKREREREREDGYRDRDRDRDRAGHRHGHSHSRSHRDRDRDRDRDRHRNYDRDRRR